MREAGHQWPNIMRFHLYETSTTGKFKEAENGCLRAGEEGQGWTGMGSGC